MRMARKGEPILNLKLPAGRLARTAVIGALFASASTAAFAQEATSTAPRSDAASASTEAKLEALEAEVQALQAQLADLKAATVAEIKDVRATGNAEPQVSLSNARLQVSADNGAFKFAARSIVQFDAAQYSVKPLRSDNDLSSGTNFRRARLGIDGSAYNDWNFALWAEFGGSGGEAAALNQAYIEYAGLKPFGPNVTVRLRAGAWATPAGLEDATSKTEELFLERAAVAETVRGLDAGDGRTGFGVFTAGNRWYFSGVFTGKVVGAPTTPVYGQQEGYLTRLAFNPLHGKDYDVHVGGSVQGVIRPADVAAGSAVNQTLSIGERPELRVDGTKLVNTGNIVAKGLTTYGAELGASFHNVYAAGEWYRIDVDRTAVGAGVSPFNPTFTGWYGQAAWTLTGERHEWSSSNGGFGGIRPLHPFDPKKNTWGAWELAARYSVLNLNDRAGSAGSAAPLGGIRGGEQKITTVGLNWYPNRVLRFLLDYQWDDIDRLNAAGAQVGEKVQAVSFRSQFAF
jgi:phosphate-selective porin OprO/OprP